MKFVVAKIERCVDRLERLEINIHTLLFAVIRQYYTTIKN